MNKNCGNCQYYFDGECFYHYIEAKPENLCDNHELDKGDGRRFELVELVAERLIGSCDFGGSTFRPLENMSDTEAGYFDELVYECGKCGWWCDGGDRYESVEVDGDCCSDCVEYEDREEED